MTAGVVKAPKAPRCGCCDALNPIALCERCAEPMCTRHLEWIREPGAIAFVCTICREAIDTEAMQREAPAASLAGVA